MPERVFGVSLFYGYTCLVLGAALLLGGGRVYGLWSDSLVYLLTLPLLAVSFFRLSTGRPPRETAIAVAAACVVFALPLIQLVPLPPSLWTALPGRILIVETFQLMGAPLTWWPLSLDPQATMLSFLALLPAIAIFLAVLLLDEAERASLTLVVLFAAVAGVLLGLVQLVQGAASPLRFFAITNLDSTTGFFANRNHNAAMFYCALPFAAAWAHHSLATRRRSYLVAAYATLTVLVLLVGATTTLSRAGAALAVLALILSLVQLVRRRVLVLAAGVLVGAAVVFLLAGRTIGMLASRFATDPLDNYRVTIVEISLEALARFFPVGSGFGTFPVVYELGDRPDAVLSAYVNHAHNEYLELLIEGGVIAAVVVLAFLVWFAIRLVAIWARPADGRDGGSYDGRAAASIAILLLLVHSLVEFPLRTTALSTLFALCCGFLVAPIHRARSAAPAARRGV